jgi:hypothetical protein
MRPRTVTRPIGCRQWCALVLCRGPVLPAQRVQRLLEQSVFPSGGVRANRRRLRPLTGPGDICVFRIPCARICSVIVVHAVCLSWGDFLSVALDDRKTSPTGCFTLRAIFLPNSELTPHDSEAALAPALEASFPNTV